MKWYCEGCVEDFGRGKHLVPCPDCCGYAESAPAPAVCAPAPTVSGGLPTRLERLKDAAEHYGVHAHTLRRWGAEGRITLYRLGPRLLFVDLDELDEFARPVPVSS